MNRTARVMPLRVAGAYAVFGMVWIVLSDRVLVWLALSPEAMVTAQTWKGWVFVLASALLVYALSRRTMEALRGRMEALRGSEERYRLLFGDNPQPMVVADPETLRIVAINAAAQKLFGYARDETLPSLRELIHPADHARFDDVRERLRLGGGEATGRWRVQTRDSGMVLVDVVSSPMEIDGRRAILSLVTDVTAQVAAESALLDATRQLERSSSEIQELSQAAAHQLQEPLRSIVSHLQLLERRLPVLDSDSRAHIGFAVEGALRMKSFVDDILHITGMEAEPLGNIDMNQVLDGVLTVLQPDLLRAEVSVSMAPLPRIRARRRHMALLFHHLIDNAIKFRHPDRPPEIRVTARRIDQCWAFTVTDNGIGIAPEHHLDIFGMFRRIHASNAVAGNGIGLAVCRKIVEQHGGEIDVASRPGEGSTFTFKLPATPPG